MNSSYFRSLKMDSDSVSIAKACIQFLFAKILKYILIDPRGRLTVSAGSVNYFHTLCPSVPTFQNLAKQKTLKVKIVIVTGWWAVCLAEGIIADTHVSCHLLLYIHIWNDNMFTNPTFIQNKYQNEESKNKIFWKGGLISHKAYLDHRSAYTLFLPALFYSNFL